jgi:hypothetical protein
MEKKKGENSKKTEGSTLHSLDTYSIEKQVGGRVREKKEKEEGEE